MRELVFAVSDDLTFAETGRKEDADHAVRILIQVDKEKPVDVELDLTGKHVAELRKLTDPFTRAGRPKDKQASAKRTRHSRDYMQALRDWADKNGLSYHTKTGKIYYSVKLYQGFEEYLLTVPAGSRP